MHLNDGNDAPKNIRLTISLPPELYQRTKADAERSDRTFAGQICHILKVYFAEHPEK